MMPGVGLRKGRRLIRYDRIDVSKHANFWYYEGGRFHARTLTIETEQQLRRSERHKVSPLNFSNLRGRGEGKLHNSTLVAGTATASKPIPIAPSTYIMEGSWRPFSVYGHAKRELVIGSGMHSPPKQLGFHAQDF
jgi:hypothetical protein